MARSNHDARIGVGVVGTGLAAKAHLEALRRVPGVEIVAVAGRERSRAATVADRYGARAYSDHLDLLADPQVEVVHTCTVNKLHHEVNLQALECGKHVLSEKPLALDSDQSAELLAAANAAAADGVLSGVCFNYRHYPLVAQIRELVRAGEYGQAHFMHGRYLQDWLLLASDWDWRLEEAEGGASRAVADIGSHWVDLVMHITGDPVTEVLADLGTLHGTRSRPANGRGSDGGEPAAVQVPVQSEDFGTVLLRFESGARGAFTVSQTSAGSKNSLSFQIDAATAAIAWNQERPDRGWVGRRGQPNLELVGDPLGPEPATAAVRLPPGHPQGWRDALCNLCLEFYGAIAASRAGVSYDGRFARFPDGDALVRLVEAAIRSHREQRSTAIEVAKEVSV